MFKAKSTIKFLNITLALAGVFQAARLANDLALTGSCDEEAFKASINSIYELNPKDVPSIYGGNAQLALGLKEIEAIFSKKKNKIKPNVHVSRYALSLILLQHKLASNKTMLDEIQKRILQVLNQVRYFSNTHETVITSLADIYLNTISSFRFRIQITGKAKYLRNPLVLNKIRALFLAGIRSAVLWQQLEGRRWHLFLARPFILKAARELINELDSNLIS